MQGPVPASSRPAFLALFSVLGFALLFAIFYASEDIRNSLLSECDCHRGP